MTMWPGRSGAPASVTHGGLLAVESNAHAVVGADRPRGRVVRHPVHGLAAIVAVLVLATGTARAGAAEVALARIVKPDGSALNSGGSGTPYGVALPSGARCPGDTAHKGYVVASYLVPKPTDPASIRWTNVPDRGLGFIANDAYFGPHTTERDSGRIGSLPTTFVFSRWTPAELFSDGAKSAMWSGGIACVASNGAVASYWNVDIVFNASQSDQGGFTWSVPGQPSTRRSSRVSTAALVLVGVVVVGGLAVMRMRKRHPALRDAGR